VGKVVACHVIARPHEQVHRVCVEQARDARPLPSRVSATVTMETPVASPQPEMSEQEPEPPALEPPAVPEALIADDAVKAEDLSSPESNPEPVPPPPPPSMPSKGKARGKAVKRKPE
jgi:hypothetical protein